MRHVRNLGQKDFVESAAKVMRNALTKHELKLHSALKLIWPDLFRPQWVMGNSILDFYSPLLNVAIEVDGKSHQTTNGQAADLLKEAGCDQRSILLIRFTNQQVEESCDSVVDEIRWIVERRALVKTRLIKWGWTLPRKSRGFLVQ